MKIDPHKQFPVRECPSCAMEVPVNSNRCPICGYEFPAAPPWRKPLLVITALVLILALLSFLL